MSNNRLYKIAKNLGLDKNDIDNILSANLKITVDSSNNSVADLYKAGTRYGTVSSVDLYKAGTKYGTISLKDVYKDGTYYGTISIEDF